MAMDLLEHLANDSARFRRALTDVEAERPVPACDGWTAEDLLWHLTRVQWLWGTVVRDRLHARPDDAAAPARPREHAAALTLFDTQSARLQQALADVDDLDEQVWSFKNDAQPLRWSVRRQAHEALIHRVDAEMTASLPIAMDPALASDGVDELLSQYVHGVPAWATFTPDGTDISVLATDTNRIWTLTLGRMTGTSTDSGRVYEGDDALDACEVRIPLVSALADTVVRGLSGDLNRWLWGRGPLSALVVAGDNAVVARARAMIANSTG
ncbi:MAG: hypothetical protein ACI970_001270 [Myxococcota bacterium]|jgi:uncharacterized protein (TIGR03083 family)